MLSGENGILRQTSTAKTENQKGTEKEQISLAYTTVKTEKLSLGNNEKVKAEELEEQLKKDYNKGAKVTGNSVLRATMPSGNIYYIYENGNIAYAGNNGNISTDFEDVKIYAKLYSYDNGSGSLLEFSSDANYVSEEEGVTLKEDYGNIGNTEYNYICEETVYEENGTRVRLETEAWSSLPPWLTAKTTDRYFLLV